MVTRQPELHFKPGFQHVVSWGLPDVAMRKLCGVCHGALPEAPLIIWRDDGSAASLCDCCVESWIEVA